MGHESPVGRQRGQASRSRRVDPSRDHFRRTRAAGPGRGGEGFPTDAGRRRGGGRSYTADACTLAFAAGPAMIRSDRRLTLRARFFVPQLERALDVIAVVALIGMIVFPLGWGYEQRQ